MRACVHLKVGTLRSAVSHRARVSSACAQTNKQEARSANQHVKRHTRARAQSDAGMRLMRCRGCVCCLGRLVASVLVAFPALPVCCLPVGARSSVGFYAAAVGSGSGLCVHASSSIPAASSRRAPLVVGCTKSRPSRAVAPPHRRTALLLRVTFLHSRLQAICAANPPNGIARRARLIERACLSVQQSMGGWLAEWRTFAMQASCLCTESAGKTNKPQDRYRPPASRWHSASHPHLLPIPSIHPSVQEQLAKPIPARAPYRVVARRASHRPDAAQIAIGVRCGASLAQRGAARGSSAL